MNAFKFLVFLMISVQLVGCDSADISGPDPVVIRPVKTMVIEEFYNGAKRSFPAVVAAAQRADLSFRVGGKINEILINEGEEVEAGQVLARLDTADLQLVVDEKSATYKRTEADFKRAKDLIGDGYISRTDYDKLEAAYQTAKAALDNAKNELSYAELIAPFNGSVSRRLVENFEEVQARQPVMELRALDTLEIKFDVPESLVQRIRRKDRTSEETRNTTSKRVHAIFDGLPGRRFELTFKEAATEADPQTQTFQVVFTMPRPEQLQVLPGMTAKVEVDISGLLLHSERERVLIPAVAVVANSELGSRVWVVEESTMTLASRPVTIGKMFGTEIEILSGLKVGDRLVVAGASYMSEGQKVRLMATPEQAEPTPMNSSSGSDS